MQIDLIDAAHEYEQRQITRAPPENQRFNDLRDVATDRRGRGFGSARGRRSFLYCKVESARDDRVLNTRGGGA
jgi:hypothetical protein